MSLRQLVTAALIAIAALAVWAWSRTTTPPPAPMSSSAGEPATEAPRVVVESGGDPGVEWRVPARWSLADGSPMRLATYSVPAAKGDREGAQCAAYYFGSGQGGDVETNVERWIGEFENPAKPERVARTVDGLPVATVRIRGTYLAHAGMGEDTGVRPHHELYGAIVDGPNGPVFFKFTGSQATVDAAASEFDGMLSSLRKK